MTTEKLIDSISSKVAELLFNLGDIHSSPKTLTKCIIFPKPKNNTRKNKRVSEQEARFLFSYELEKKHVIYSVETPTTKKYRFSPNAKRDTSASIDLCIYKMGQQIYERDILVEFKAHTQDCKTDFQKLLNEDENGIFFHLLEKVDNSTLTIKKNNTKGVLSHYISDFDHETKNKNLTKLKKDNWFIRFYICCLSPRFLISKSMGINDLENVMDFFKLEYKVDSKNNTIQFTNLNKWTILKNNDVIGIT